MADIRESILARVKAMIDAEVTAERLSKSFRNLTELHESARPAAILFDGLEETSDRDSNKHGESPRRVVMLPQILLLVGEQPENVGTDLNTVRANLIYAIMGDTTLNNLSTNGAGLRYEGCEPYFQSGRVIEGALLLKFSIEYVMRRADLAPAA